MPCSYLSSLAVNQVDGQLQQLRATQAYLYWRERRHRQTVDSTNKRVLWYAIARSATLVVVSIAQVRALTPTHHITALGTQTPACSLRMGTSRLQPSAGEPTAFRLASLALLWALHFSQGRPGLPFGSSRQRQLPPIANYVTTAHHSIFLTPFTCIPHV
jgi:hypothetical protein